MERCQEQYAPKDGGGNVHVGVSEIVGSPTPAYEQSHGKNKDVGQPRTLNSLLESILVQGFKCSNEGANSEDAQVPQGAVSWKFVKVIDEERGEDDGCEESDRKSTRLNSSHP